MTDCQKRSCLVNYKKLAKDCREDRTWDLKMASREVWKNLDSILYNHQEWGKRQVNIEGNTWKMVTVKTGLSHSKFEASDLLSVQIRLRVRLMFKQHIFNVFTSTLLPLLPVSMGYSYLYYLMTKPGQSKQERFENKTLDRRAVQVDICVHIVSHVWY